MDDERTRRRVAIVGASGGIGSALVSAFIDDDVDLFLTANSRYDELVERSKEASRSRKASIQTFRADLSNVREAARLAEALLKTPRLDSLAVASGIDLMSRESKSLDFDERLAKAWQVDVASTITLARIVGKALAERRRVAADASFSPSVVLFGWDGVSRGQEGETAQIYAACKGAVVAFAKSLAQDLAPYVRVNAVSPGWIKTTWGAVASDAANRRAVDESLAKRWGSAKEVADVVRFLLSDESSFINGQDVQVNGGFSYLRRN